MRLRVQHETLYRYAEVARYTIQALRLTPRREALQHLLSWSMDTPGRRTEQLDAHGNVVHYLTLEAEHRELRLRVEGVVDTDATDGQPNYSPTQLSPLAYQTQTALTGTDPALADFAREAFGPAGDLLTRMVRVAQAVAGKVSYRTGSSLVSDTAIAAFTRGEGVCQDQAHVFIAACRAVGVPARYVSGYLHAGTGENVASHAWVEVWLESAGHWYGIDVTHGHPTGANYCRLAVGRDYQDAAPVRGMRRGGGHEQMQVSVLVSDAAQQ
jgi:transglutaminase-like putative cysteine protease